MTAALLKHPGHPDQSVHAGGRLTQLADGFDERLANAAKGQDALDAAPAALKRAPQGHFGNFDGEGWERQPEGAGSLRSLSEYEGAYYQETNDHLRHPQDTSTIQSDVIREAVERNNKVIEERITELDKTMAASPLAEDVEVHRVVRHGANVFGAKAYYGELDFTDPDIDLDEADRRYDRWAAGERPSLVGASWIERGYSSTTADPKVVEQFGNQWREFNSAGEGEPVVYRMLVPTGVGAVQLAEMGNAAELLLQHDLKMTVVADHGVDGDGYRRVDIEVSKP